MAHGLVAGAGVCGFAEQSGALASRIRIRRKDDYVIMTWQTSSSIVAGAKFDLRARRRTHVYQYTYDKTL